MKTPFTIKKKKKHLQKTFCTSNNKKPQPLLARVYSAQLNNVCHTLLVEITANHKFTLTKKKNTFILRKKTERERVQEKERMTEK